MTMTWDQDNHLASSNANSYATYYYDYDALGRRVAKRESAYGSLRIYVSDGQQEVAEYNNITSTITYYNTVLIYETGSVLALKQKFVYAEYIDEPALMVNVSYSTSGAASETKYYYRQNNNYNVMGLTDQSGQRVESYAYDAYGRVTFINSEDYESSNQLTSAVDNPFLFTGRRYDPETGFYHFRSRPYDARIARFLSRDPIGYFLSEELDVSVGGLITPLIGNGSTWLNMLDNTVNTGEINDLNLYRYAQDNPLIFTDPEGHSAVACCLPLAGGAAAADGPLPIGDIAACCLLTGAAIWDWCHTCPPCPPPPPPYIRYDRVPPSSLHAPCPGSHTHTYWYETNQSPYPDCRCFNNKKEHVTCH